MKKKRRASRIPGKTGTERAWKAMDKAAKGNKKSTKRHAVKKSKPSCKQRTKLDTNVYQVFRDANGIAYLRVGFSPKGAQFVVNKAFSVELVDIDANSTYGHHLAMRAVPNASIVECAKRLLHPLNDQCTISQRAKEHLIQILNTKELQMKATTPNARAVTPNKFAKVTAPPAKNARAAKPVKDSKPAGKAKSANTERAPRTSDEIYQSKVVATNKEAREGSFFHTVVTLAKKPIVLETLVNQVTKAVGKSLKSDKDPAVVCRTRTRDSIKLGFLKQLK